jgi:crotonobetainyl-CoA:carnitine CoA-transferase CaiB-like acyl-CoA transferase
MLVHDIGTGALAAMGILTALYWRESSGQGQHVTTSLANSSLMLQAGEFTTYPGRPEPQQGGRDWAGPNALHRLYECADGWVFVAAQQDQTVAVARAVRVDPTTLSAETIADALRTEPALATLDRFDVEGVVAARVLSRHQAFTDSWLLDNDFYHVISDARLGWCRVVRTVTDWPDCPDVADPRSFALGEDTEEVLGEYGFAAEKIAALLRSGAARKWSPEA